MSQSKGTILVVEDDTDLAAALRLILEAAGFDVVLAEEAEEGLELAESERPSLILLDVMMPEGTEGFHFVWKLRQRDTPARSIPIIMMTAIHQKTDLRFYPDSQDGTYRAGEYLPVEDFLDKPVKPEVLIDRIERVLMRHSQ